MFPFAHACIISSKTSSFLDAVSLLYIRNSTFMGNNNLEKDVQD